MQSEFHEYNMGNTQGEAFVASVGDAKKPVVLIAHAWAGQMPFEQNIAKEIAKLGYIGIAIDMYGKGVRGEPSGDNSHLMMPLVENRAELLKRLEFALEFAKSLKNAEISKIAIIGFCFGGMCALDFARSGNDDIKASVAFHALLGPNGLAPKPSNTSVLICHGFDDQMAKPDELVALGHELTAAGADWQIHAFGNTSHAFTNPNAKNVAAGLIFNPKSRDRAWELMIRHLQEAFDKV